MTTKLNDEEDLNWMNETDGDPPEENKAEGDGATWVPYTGDRGGEGWKNVDTGDVDYGPEPPGEVSLDALQDYDLVNLAHERFDLSEEDTVELVNSVESREELESLVADRLGLETGDPVGEDTADPSADPSPIKAGSVAEGDEILIDGEEAEVTTKKDMGAGFYIAGENDAGDIVTARVGPDAEFEQVTTGTDGVSTAGDISEGDRIVMDGERTTVETYSDMGGGFYIAGRDENDEVHTARVGPDVEFDTWSEGDEPEPEPEPEPDWVEGDRVRLNDGTFDEVDMRIVGIDTGACPPGKYEVESAEGATYCVEDDDLTEHPEGKYETDSEFSRELAADVRQGEMPGTDAIYRNMGKVDDPWLVADALELELDGKNRKTSTERLVSKLGTFDDGPTEAEVRARLRDDAGPGPDPEPDGDYGGDYASASGELDAIVSGDASPQGRYQSTKGGFGYDLDAVERLSDEATTEELESAYADAQEASKWGKSDEEKLIGGLLHYRDDSDVDWEDAIGFDTSNAASARADPDDVRRSATESFDMLDPAVGAQVMSQTGSVTVSPTPKGKSRIGVYTHRGQNPTTHKEGGGYQPSTTKHEIGHAVHYALGVSGRTRTDNSNKSPQRISNRSYTVETPGGMGSTRENTDKTDDMKAELEDQLDTYIERMQEHGGRNSECRNYQRTNAEEFMAVTFAHWQDDRAKLERTNPEMADFWDRQVGHGVATEHVDLPDIGEMEGTMTNIDIDDLDDGDRVNVTLQDGTEIRNTEYRSANGHGFLFESGPSEHRPGWDEVASVEKRQPAREVDKGDYNSVGDDLVERLQDGSAAARASLTNEIGGEEIRVEYDGGSFEDVEMQDITDQTLWLRDPTKTGPMSEHNVPWHELEDIEVRG